MKAKTPAIQGNARKTNTPTARKPFGRSAAYDYPFQTEDNTESRRALSRAEEMARREAKDAREEEFYNRFA